MLTGGILFSAAEIWVVWGALFLPDCVLTCMFLTAIVALTFSIGLGTCLQELAV